MPIFPVSLWFVTLFVFEFVSNVGGEKVAFECVIRRIRGDAWAFTWGWWSNCFLCDSLCYYKMASIVFLGEQLGWR